MSSYDVIVIGAGFSGLSSALSAARKGLKVLVIEKNKKIGKPVRTTGIFLQKIVEDFNIPKRYLIDDIKGSYFTSPSGKTFKIDFGVPRFYMGDITGFEKHLAEDCKRWRVKFQLNTPCKDINIKRTKVKINSHESKTVVLACGSNRDLVEKLTGDYVKKYLIGFELMVEGLKPKNLKYWELFFNYDIAPGYTTWIAPHTNNKSHIGLCRYSPCKTNIKDEILEFFSNRIEKNFKIDEIRSNLIPISGPIKKTFGDRFLVIGDAAGQTGALSAGGIYFGLNIGRMIGEVLFNHIDDPSEENLVEYEEKWKGKYLRSLKLELMTRKIYDKIDSNEELEEVLDFLNDTEFISKKMFSEDLLNNYDLSHKHIIHYLFPFLIKEPKKSLDLLRDLF